MHDHAVVTTFSLVLVILKNNAIFARLKSNYLKNLNNMRKFFGILAFAAAFLGMTACEEDIVEEGAVVHAFLGELDEVVAVLRCFVIQSYHDVALSGFQFNLRTFFHVVLLVRACSARGQNAYKEHGYD